MEIPIPNVVVHYDDIELALHRSGAKGQDSKFLDVPWTWMRQLECRQGVS